LSLPINSIIPELLTKLNSCSAIVLQAEPGAGKSTAVPIALLNADIAKGKKIIMLEPRRVAARSIAHYLAQQLGEKVGASIGYRIKNESKIGKETMLEIVTEGILTRMLQSDPELSDVGLVIFDEFHERSIHADTSLLLLKEVQAALRDDLKLLVMSATIDAEQISSYLDNAPVLTCSGKCFPVSIEYRELAQTRIEQKVSQLVHSNLDMFEQGSMLVFLPGMGEINRCFEALRDNEHIEVSILHGSMDLKDQSRVLKAAKGKRVILSTNIAETSLTIPDVKLVIDSGLEKRMYFEPQSGLSKLLTVQVSKASAEQRAGRAGRVQAGHCIRLWSESKQNQLLGFAPVEITTSDLSTVVMELANWGEREFEQVDWLTSPPAVNLKSSVNYLQRSGFLNKDNSPATKADIIQETGLSPRMADIIYYAQQHGVLKQGCHLVALLSERDPLSQSQSVDLMLRLNLLSQKSNHNRLKQINLTAGQLEKRFIAKPQQQFSDLIANLNDEAIYAALLALAFPDRIGKKRSKSGEQYLLANGKGVQLRESDMLNEHQWLVVTDSEISQSTGRIYSAIAIDESLITSLLATHIKTTSYCLINEKNGRFESVVRTSLGRITLNEEQGHKINDSALQEMLKEQVLKHKQQLFNWTKGCQQLTQRLTWLAKYDDSYAQYADIWQTCELWLLPYVGKITALADLKNVNILPLLEAAIDYSLFQHLGKLAPIYYKTPSGKDIPIRYDEHQGPTVSVILQEVFGEQVSPMLAGNKIALRFELLSPARRPIQITSDIVNFWHTSYIEVAKEMKAKYPKHRWPEDPVNEKAGSSLKRR